MCYVYQAANKMWRKKTTLMKNDHPISSALKFFVFPFLFILFFLFMFFLFRWKLLKWMISNLTQKKKWTDALLTPFFLYFWDFIQRTFFDGFFLFYSRRTKWYELCLKFMNNEIGTSFTLFSSLLYLCWDLCHFISIDKLEENARKLLIFFFNDHIFFIFIQKIFRHNHNWKLCLNRLSYALI